jgi:hypothetical protein
LRKIDRHFDEQGKYGLAAPTGEPIPAGEANELRGFDEPDGEL